MSAQDGAARKWLVRLAALVVPLGAIAGIAIALQAGSARQDGPRPIAWGDDACAHCRMHISDPRHAAQVVIESGEAANYDDPGCLLLELDERQTSATAIYFRHAHEDRWLRAPNVAFVRGGPTPMNFDLLAVDPGTPGALSLAEAARAVREKRQAGGDRPAPEPGAHP